MTYGKLLLLALVSASQPSLAYKFICNGMDARGTVESDECGSCTDATGPRWVPSFVNVKIDSKVLPKGLTAKAWLEVATGSMQSWNEVSGADLDLHSAGEAKTRGFGSNSREHEVFWITDRTEWRRKVGGGEYGALGVTVAPYGCPSRARGPREIYDADLVMNGVAKFQWKTVCGPRDKNCQSIRSTLTHEFGHFVGLGHPCTICDWSIMSAQAGYNVDYPVFDDQEGLRALYPGQTSGGMGTACAKSSDCATDLQCISHAEAKYCTQECETGSCPKGFSCEGKAGQRMCKFASARFADAVGVGERCVDRPCQEGLVCAGSGGSHFYCFNTCSTQEPCAANEGCVPLQLGGGLCVKESDLGEACDFKTNCEKGAVCVLETENSGSCRKACVLNSTKKQCDAGERCTKLTKDEFACMPGKTVEISEAVGQDSDQVSAKPQLNAFGCSAAPVGQSNLEFFALLFLLRYGMRRHAFGVRRR